MRVLPLKNSPTPPLVAPFILPKDPFFEASAKEFLGMVRVQQKFPLDLVKSFRKSQELSLHQCHSEGGSGRDNVSRRAHLVDVIFKAIFEFYTREKREECSISVAAFGGYGRHEMSPYSDVDIIFLHKSKKLTESMEKSISSILMALWDSGFKVGHATRSLTEAIDHANEEMLSKTALLECRFLAGDKAIFKKFKERFRKKCILGQEEPYFDWRLENIQKLREKFGKSVFMQEPHIKSGSGGLRDYQNLLWISIVKSGSATHRYLTENKFLRESERKKLENNYDFLLRVRNEMHYQEKRANDQLTLRLQGCVATALGYPQRGMIRRSEAFMKDYYEKAREVNLITTAVLERLKISKKKPGFLRHFFPSKKEEERFDGLILRAGVLFPENREIFKEPIRLMRVFHLAQKRALLFSPELSDLVKRRTSLVDEAFRKNLEVRDLFLSILSAKGEVGRILRLMHDLGFLGSYLPEFGALTCLVQHEFYHRYSADEHTLVCIEKIDDLLFTKNKKLSGYSTLFKSLDDPAMLYLGMLLHDTGKAAHGKQHAKASTLAAQKVATRLQLKEKSQQRLIILVEAHGELATVARTRDLDDFSTINQFANVIKEVPTLDALMILTLADGMGTSDTQWSDWKEQLVWNLYMQTKRYLEIGAPFFEKSYRDKETIKTVVKDLLSTDFKEEIEVHFQQMPERYFRMVEPSLIAEQLKLFRSFFERFQQDENSSLRAEIRWREHPTLGHTEVWICGWDRNHLLQRIAAAFLKAQINILSADIFTRGDQLTLDIFRVTSVRRDPLLNEKEKKCVEGTLEELLAHNKNHELPECHLSLLTSESMEPVDGMISPKILIDNQSHPFYTLIEVEAPDRQGLFYELLRALQCHGISIDLARIATEMNAAFDTFYILGKNKKKIIEEDLVKEIQDRLLLATADTKRKLL